MAWPCAATCMSSSHYAVATSGACVCDALPSLHLVCDGTQRSLLFQQPPSASVEPPPRPTWPSFDTIGTAWRAVEVPVAVPIANVRDTMDTALRIKVRGEARPYYGSRGVGSLYAHTTDDVTFASVLVQRDESVLHL